MTRFAVTKKPTNLFGLTYAPSIDPTSDGEDWIRYGLINGKLEDMQDKHSVITREFSEKDEQVLLDVMQSLKPMSIMEIGVYRSRAVSSTATMLRVKDPQCKYIGIDLDPNCVNAVVDHSKNVYGLVCNSSDFVQIHNYLLSNGILKLDLLLIDGNHSINQVLDDWKYASLLRQGGVALFHDTNYHPGPHCILDAIDPQLFEVKRYWENEAYDWGVSTVTRL